MQGARAAEVFNVGHVGWRSYFIGSSVARSERDSQVCTECEVRRDVEVVVVVRRDEERALRGVCGQPTSQSSERSAGMSIKLKLGKHTPR